MYRGHPPTSAMISLLLWPFWFTVYTKRRKEAEGDDWTEGQ